MNPKILTPYKIPLDILILFDTLKEHQLEIPKTTHKWAITNFYAHRRCDLNK